MCLILLHTVVTTHARVARHMAEKTIMNQAIAVKPTLEAKVMNMGKAARHMAENTIMNQARAARPTLEAEVMNMGKAARQLEEMIIVTKQMVMRRMGTCRTRWLMKMKMVTLV